MDYAALGSLTAILVFGLFPFLLGGIYYLIRRWPNPFRQTVSNRWLIVSSVMLFLLSISANTP